MGRKYHRTLGEAFAEVLFEEAKREEERWKKKLRKRGVIK